MNRPGPDFAAFKAAQHVGKSRDPSSTEYLYVTVWEDVESIRAFAGERWQEAVITQGPGRVW